MAFGPSGRGARLGGMFAFSQAQNGMNQAREDLDRGFQQAQDFSERASGFLTPMYGQAMRGFNAYADRAGVNGADGQARAMEDFDRSVYGRAGEDYGTQGVMRNAAGMGLQASGNNMAALGDFLARNRAQNYTTFAQLAAPYNSIAPALGGQLASQQQGLGSLAAQIAAQKAQAAQQGYQQMGSAGGAALAAGDQVRQQMTNLGMAGLGLLGQGIGALAGGGMPGLGSMVGGGNALSSALSTLGSSFRPQPTGFLY